MRQGCLAAARRRNRGFAAFPSLFTIHCSLFVMVMALVLFFCGMYGCKKQEQAATEAKFAIEKQYKRGPVTFTLKAGKKEMTIADRLRLVLEVAAKEDYEVELPEFGDKLEQFGIVDYQAPLPRLLGEGMVQYRKEYELEPFLSGQYTIPAMKVRFRQKDKEETMHEVESEPLTITVKSLLPENGVKAGIKDIVPPVELPGAGPILWYSLAGGLLLCGAGAAGFLIWRRKRRRQEIVVRQPPDEIAYAKLEALLAEDLVGKGDVKEFYLRLSAILRHYIEDRFSLRAPERTTEEFLPDLQSSTILIPPHKGLLQEFLLHCDMVKFALHHPANREIQQAFDSCKRFIAETAGPGETAAGTAGPTGEIHHAV